MTSKFDRSTDSSTEKTLPQNQGQKGRGDRKIKIMPLGDSITAGYFAGNGGYRRPLHSLLSTEGVYFDFVGRSVDQSDDFADPEHEGYPGFTIDQIKVKAHEGIKIFNPDMILLFAGTNDIRVNGNNDVPANPVYWKTAVNRLDTMLEEIFMQAPGVTVLVGTLLPFAESWKEREFAAVEFNQRLQEIVRKHQNLPLGARQTYMVDFREYVTEHDLSDGLHPNAKGYENMAQGWFALMQNHGLLGLFTD